MNKLHTNCAHYSRSIIRFFLLLITPLLLVGFLCVLHGFYLVVDPYFFHNIPFPLSICQLPRPLVHPTTGALVKPNHLSLN